MTTRTESIVAFHDTRDSTAQGTPDQTRTISWSSSREHRNGLAGAAFSVWPTAGPITIDHATGTIFAGTPQRPIGVYTEEHRPS